MLQAGSERPLPAGSLWVPGMSPQQTTGSRLWVPGMSPQQAAPYGGASPSARAQEIARRRDEMLGMLHGLPESDYELSLTDLVEKTNGGGNNVGMAHPLPLPPPPTLPSERKEASQPSPLGKPAGAGAGLSESGRHAEQLAAARTERRGSSRRRGDSGSGSSGRSSFRSSSDGVLLNFYMPRSFTRSFTSPRASHHAPSAVSAIRAASAVVVGDDDSNKRERDSDTVRCWPMPWDRRWRKSSRPDQAGGESEAILKNSAPEENV